MSRLSVYWPEDANSSQAPDENPAIVAFPRNIKRPSAAGTPLDVVTRARLFFQNRRCRGCGYPVVDPVELADSVVNRNGMSIPGTATLIGFRCRGCKCEWSIDDAS